MEDKFMIAALLLFLLHVKQLIRGQCSANAGGKKCWAGTVWTVHHEEIHNYMNTRAKVKNKHQDTVCSDYSGAVFCGRLAWTVGTAEDLTGRESSSCTLTSLLQNGNYWNVTREATPSISMSPTHEILSLFTVSSLSYTMVRHGQTVIFPLPRVVSVACFLVVCCFGGMCWSERSWKRTKHRRNVTPLGVHNDRIVSQPELLEALFSRLKNGQNLDVNLTNYIIQCDLSINGMDLLNPFAHGFSSLFEKTCCGVKS